MKKKILLLLVLVVIAFAVDAHAYLVGIDFEGVLTTYYQKFGNQNLGTYYPGLNFQSDVTILDRVIGGYNSTVYPPMSGDAVFFSYSGGADIIFDTPTTYFEGWFTHMNGYGLDIYAYDTNGVQVGMVSISYWDAHLARLYRDEMVKISLSAPSIKRVFINGSGDCWAGDSIKYESDGHTIPEPATLSLLGIGLIGIALRKNRRVRS